MITTLLLVLAGQTLEAEGEAPLALGYVQAVQRAKDEALKKLILAACTDSLRADGKDEQCASDERVLAEFAGRVTHFEVLSQQQTRDRVKVKARANVALKSQPTDKLDAERLYRERAGSLRLSVGVIEEVLDAKRRPIVWAGTVASRLSELFAADGFHPHLLEPLDGSDVSAVQAAAKDDNTDYALVGRVTLSRGGEQAYVSGRLVVIDLARGVVVAQQPVELSGPLTSRLERVGQELVEPELPKWATALRAGIVQSLRDAEAKGDEVTVKVAGLKGQAQADALFAKLQTVKGVVEARGGFGDGALSVTLRTKVPARELARTLSKFLSISAVRSTSIEASAK